MAAVNVERILKKIMILADAAKYDVSCASSGVVRTGVLGHKAKIGSTFRRGICHSFTPDGRCISLLKILLTNQCRYDCLYCINRTSSNVPRARFSPEEIVWLTLDLYRRNCIEGLFLSSGVMRSPDHTMEQLVAMARSLRERHGFMGYIHLKTIPGASALLIDMAGRYADRISANVELPDRASLSQLAPDKDARAIHAALHLAHAGITEARTERRLAEGRIRALPNTAARPAQLPRFAPGGQSTQMIVGADASNDATILSFSQRLYQRYGLRRVYYSAFSPVPGAASCLPHSPPPLRREHRLYQADWLMRFYGFSADAILDAAPDGMLATGCDPKLAWALRHREFFPVDLQSAPREALLRVPGLGVRIVDRLLATRRVRTLRLTDLMRQKTRVTKMLPFICVSDHHPGRSLERPNPYHGAYRTAYAGRVPEQLVLFDLP